MKLFENIKEGLTFFLHFLVVTSALVSSSCSNKFTHLFENFLSSSKAFLTEVFLINRKENTVSVCLVVIPVPDEEFIGARIFEYSQHLFSLVWSPLSSVLSIFNNFVELEKGGVSRFSCKIYDCHSNEYEHYNQ